MPQPAPSQVAPGKSAKQVNVAPNQRTATPNLRASTSATTPAATPPAQQQRPADNAKRTVGLAPGNTQKQLSPAERQKFIEARRAPILRSPVFAATVGATGGAAAASLSRATFRGAFADSRFARDPRFHHHRLGFVLGFVGPVFWPYAYDDFVEYTYWPYAYDTFWPYAFDDVFAGIYGGYAPEYYAADDAYAYAGAAASERTYARYAGTPPRPANASAAQSRICSGETQGLTDFSIDKIAQQVQPDRSQQKLLNQLKDATVNAINVLQDACPTDLPSTPTGRLDAMLTRVNAMLQAVQIVRSPLEKFYQSLNDEQRERFNTLDQGIAAGRARGYDLARLCNGRAASAATPPTARIERALRLSADQQAGLKELEQASTRAADMLKAKCEPVDMLTPTGRLAAMEERLGAMAQALKTTQAALTRFYGSLSDEQKARFDRLRATT